MDHAKYCYLIPRGGWNDCMQCIDFTYKYCERNGRILLLDTVNSRSDFNFSDLFDITLPNVIYDYEIIKQIINQDNITFYPKSLGKSIQDQTFVYKHRGKINGVPLTLPKTSVDADIIIYSTCGSGAMGFTFFEKYIKVNENVVKYCITTLKNMKKENDRIVTTHIRNTDRKTDYVKLFEKYVQDFMQYDMLYICTDDNNVIEYYKNTYGFCYNNTSFPNNNYRNLHENDTISGNVKMIDLLFDIYIVTVSHIFIDVKARNSNFTTFLSKCHQNKNIIEKFHIK